MKSRKRGEFYSLFTFIILFCNHFILCTWLGGFLLYLLVTDDDDGVHKRPGYPFGVLSAKEDTVMLWDGEGRKAQCCFMSWPEDEEWWVPRRLWKSE